jgi:hypothetical protein
MFAITYMKLKEKSLDFDNLQEQLNAANSSIYKSCIAKCEYPDKKREDAMAKIISRETARSTMKAACLNSCNFPKGNSTGQLIP